jgi:hypothetical protein
MSWAVFGIFKTALAGKRVTSPAALPSTADNSDDVMFGEYGEPLTAHGNPLKDQNGKPLV